MRWARALVLASLLTQAVACPGGCGQTAAIATVALVVGPVEADHAKVGGPWSPADVGHRLASGDGIRTGVDGRAIVRLGSRGSLHVHEDSLVRFFADRASRGRASISVEAGEAWLEGATDGLEFQTEVGLAKLDAGSQVRLARDGTTLRLEVLMGRALFDRGFKGDVLAIEAGRGLHVDIGRAVFEPFASRLPPDAMARFGRADGIWAMEDQGPDPSGEAETSEGAAGTTGDDERTAPEEARDSAGVNERAGDPEGGGVQAGGVDAAEVPASEEVASPKTRWEPMLDRPPDLKRPERADFTLVAGGSVRVHDPLAPTALGVDFERHCPDEGVLELAPGHARRSRSGWRTADIGRGHALVLLPPGNHRYRIRCVKDGLVEVGQSAVQGAIRVTRLSGRARLPPFAGTNTLDADGRRYTVLYQTLLPRLAFSWRQAPATEGPFHLEIEGEGPRASPPRRFTASTPSFTLASGDLREGTYRFQWREESGQRRSRETWLRLDFDNAAPTVQLREPPVEVPRESREVTIEGGAIPGARVFVQGIPAELDRHLRFQATARPHPEENAVAVRIDHPRGGTHYYVRKLAPSAPP